MVAFLFGGTIAYSSCPSVMTSGALERKGYFFPVSLPVR